MFVYVYVYAYVYRGGGGGAVYKNKSRKRIYTKTFGQVKALQSFYFFFHNYNFDWNLL